MSASGKARMGTERQMEKIERWLQLSCLNNPLIDEYTLQGAKGLLVNITGGSDIKLLKLIQQTRLEKRLILKQN